jgi:cell division protein FtsI/penicillin-binding protein 2
MDSQASRVFLTPIQRIRVWYAFLLLLSAVFIIRLFYLQVIRHDYYQNAALEGQLKEYEIPAARGVIEVHSGDTVVPIVLNETRYTLFADPVYVKDPKRAADAVARIVGGNANDYERKIKTPGTRYVVLVKKLQKPAAEQIKKLELKGIGTREVPQRTYPQGSLAAQVLGFVNDEGQGKYGLEQALDKELKGTPGQLKAITDARGVPLAANRDNLVTEPQAGVRTTLTIDIALQQQLEDVLKAGLERAKSDSGSALVLEVKTGAIKAMANYPTYNPAEFYKVEDGNVFNNSAVSSPLEVGSIMKPLTTAAALDLGVVTKDTTYYDPGVWQIDDAKITNVEEVAGAGTKSVGDILRLSLNTGATWLLMQMGGGKINEQARTRWYDYMTKHYHFGEITGIEQGFEAEGYVPHPTEGYGLNIQYANTAFGQGTTETPLQMGAAFASIINNGTRVRPHLVEKTTDAHGKVTIKQPEVLQTNVVKPEVSRNVRELLEFAYSKNYRLYGMAQLRPEFTIGAKTGTAQAPKPGGGYYTDRYNGTFLGYIGGNEPQYVVVVRVNEPKIAGYAGSKAAGPIFVELANIMMNNFSVTPKM